MIVTFAESFKSRYLDQNTAKIVVFESKTLFLSEYFQSIVNDEFNSKLAMVKIMRELHIYILTLAIFEIKLHVIIL